jgi:hypothetical protein
MGSAATYSLIYAFLNARGDSKAAAAVKKAAQPVIVLKDNVSAQAGSELEQAVKLWRADQAKKCVR